MEGKKEIGKRKENKQRDKFDEMKNGEGRKEERKEGSKEVQEGGAGCMAIIQNHNNIQFPFLLCQQIYKILVIACWSVFICVWGSVHVGVCRCVCVCE